MKQLLNHQYVVSLPELVCANFVHLNNKKKVNCIF